MIEENLHRMNTLLPITSTAYGIEIGSNLEQSANASFPMEVTDFGFVLISDWKSIEMRDRRWMQRHPKHNRLKVTADNSTAILSNCNLDRIAQCEITCERVEFPLGLSDRVLQTLFLPIV